MVSCGAVTPKTMRTGGKVLDLMKALKQSLASGGQKKAALPARAKKQQREPKRVKRPRNAA